MNCGQYQVLHVHIFQILSLLNSHIKHQCYHTFAENFEPLKISPPMSFPAFPLQILCPIQLGGSV